MRNLDVIARVKKIIIRGDKNALTDTIKRVQFKDALG